MPNQPISRGVPASPSQNSFKCCGLVLWYVWWTLVNCIWSFDFFFLYFQPYFVGGVLHVQVKFPFYPNLKKLISPLLYKLKLWNFLWTETSSPTLDTISENCSVCRHLSPTSLWKCQSFHIFYFICTTSEAHISKNVECNIFKLAMSIHLNINFVSKKIWFIMSNISLPGWGQSY